MDNFHNLKNPGCYTKTIATKSKKVVSKSGCSSTCAQTSEEVPLEIPPKLHVTRPDSSSQPQPQPQPETVEE